MAFRSGIRYDSQRRDRNGASIGQTSDEPLTFTVPDKATVGAASAVLLAAATGTGRNVWLCIPSSADTGIHINFAAAATTNKFLLPPGVYILPTEQAIHAIRAGAADVAVYLMAGVV